MIFIGFGDWGFLKNVFLCIMELKVCIIFKIWECFYFIFNNEKGFYMYVKLVLESLVLLGYLCIN